MSFRWIRPPSELAKGVDEYGKRAYVAIHAAAAYWGEDTQNKARKRASWKDRTGNARSGIFYAVEGFGLGTVTGEMDATAEEYMQEFEFIKAEGDTLIIAVSHTVFYGKYLETYHGERFAIILSTIQGNIPKLERMLRDIFR